MARARGPLPFNEIRLLQDEIKDKSLCAFRCIASAFLPGPGLVIADAPTTGPDVTGQAQILDRFRRAVTDDGAGALLVTHDLGVVANYCTRVCVMYGGRIVETGTVPEVFAAPRHPYTAALLESVPVIGQPLRSLPGQAPNLRSLPVGCAFHNRCAFVREECAGTPPPWREVGATNGFLCHLVDGAPPS